MKLRVISIVLLGSSALHAESLNITDAHQETVKIEESIVEQTAQEVQEERNQEIEDAFDLLIEDEDVPADMLMEPRPISALEGYLKEVGIQVFMKYITFRVWVEHHWRSWTANDGAGHGK